MDPVDYQPPLTWRSHAWRLVIVLILSALAFAPRAEYLWTNARWWFVADLLVGVASLVLVQWRRTYPVTVATVTNLLVLVSTTASGPASLALVSLATRRRWKEIVPIAVLTAAASVGAEAIYTDPAHSRVDYVDQAVIVVMVALMVAWGLYIGSRRELLASWRVRAQSAEAEQAAKVRQAQSAERARIAREMHDVLAHRISTIHMYSGALTFRDDLPAEQVRDAAQTIQDMSAKALAELRDVLGVLREGPGDAEPEPPQAAAADIVELIDDNRSLGMRVALECDIDLAEIPDPTGRALFRCVQEGLTNARKHAPATAVAVTLRGSAEHGVDLVISNPLPVGGRALGLPASGFGLVGLAERVELRGGKQAARVTADDRFVLRVWLPWQT